MAARDDEDDVRMLPSTTSGVETTDDSLLSTGVDVYPLEGAPALVDDSDLHSLLVSINIGMVLLDRHARIRRFTPAATGLFSFLPADIGRPIGDLSPKFDDPTFLDDIVAVLGGAESSRREVLGHDGHWYVRRTLPHRREDGALEGAVVTFTEGAVDAQQVARLYAMAIVNSVRDPLMVVDARMRVHSINQPFTEFFGASGDDVLGRPLDEVCDGVWNDAALLHLLPAMLEDGAPSNELVEIAYPSAEGLRMLLVSPRVLRSGEGQPALILLAIDDVTEQRRVESLLEQAVARRDQDDHSRQRRIDLSNSLRISTVGELATGLSHALNQPLASIANVVEACRRYVQSGTIDPTKLLDLLASISSDSMRAADILAQLRSFVDKGLPRMETVDILELVRRTPHLLAYELERTQITVRFDLPDEPLLVRADSVQIEHVLLNLLQNAIDGIGESGADGAARDRVIELKVRATRRQAEVTVADSGAGISPASAARLFEPFFTTKPLGLGMGLALSRSILEAHRGRIWIEVPPPGSTGAIVRFSIPLKGRARRRELRA